MSLCLAEIFDFGSSKSLAPNLQSLVTYCAGLRGPADNSLVFLCQGAYSRQTENFFKLDFRLKVDVNPKQKCFVFEVTM